MAASIAAGISGPLAEAVAALGDAAEVVRRYGPWAGGLLVLVGAAALTAGARSRYVLGVLGGAALGAIAALAARGWIAAHLGLSRGLAATLGAAAGAALGAAWPAAFPFAAGAIPGAILGASVPLSGRAILGAAAGGALGGVVGLLVGRPAATALVSLLGGALVAIGGVGLLGSRPFAAELCARPFALAAAVVVLGIAGAAYQISAGAGAPRNEAAPHEPLRGPG